MTNIDEIMLALKAIEANVTRALLLLQGNGDPESGIQTRLIRLEGSVSNCQKSNQDCRTNRVAVTCAVISAVAVIITAILVYWK